VVLMALKKPEKLAVGIVVSENGLLGGMKSWNPVAVDLSMAEAMALAYALQRMSEAYVTESKQEQILLAEFREIWKEKKKK